MNRDKERFNIFLSSLAESEKTDFKSLTEDWKLHIQLNRRDSSLLLGDLINAASYLQTKGMTISRILTLTDSSNLGGFYAHEASTWYPLDDAAKIYPLSMKSGRMQMFRLSCVLKDKIEPCILQLALDFTIKRFPSFATCVRKGFFWHYLDSVKKRFEISEEKGAPCQPLKIGTAGTQSFRVMYFENRISVEFFHVLTDGTGGLIFLKTLVGEYFRILGNEFSYTDGVLDINKSAQQEELSNEFKRLCPRVNRSGGFIGKPALQMSGTLTNHIPSRIIQLDFSTEELLKKAHSYNTSVTAFLLAMMFIANKNATEAIDGPVQMQVPVNMRKFYDSSTLRNFALYCSIDIPLSKINDFSLLTEEISRQLSEKSDLDELAVMMSTSHKLVSSLKLVPLAVKSPVAKAVYGFLGDARFSNTLSNLGVVRMPEGIADKIDSFQFVLGTCAVSRASCAVCSYGGKTVFSISKSTLDPSFEESMIRTAAELGLKTEISGSPVYD